jgi:predicted RNase H-like HicB family nuclease
MYDIRYGHYVPLYEGEATQADGIQDTKSNDETSTTETP